jgi:hypothetical protein
MTGVAITKMYSLINTGRIRSILLDGKRLIDMDSIENLEVVAATPPAPKGTVPMLRGGPGRRQRGNAGAAAVMGSATA